jgi:hypothetical protein
MVTAAAFFVYSAHFDYQQKKKVQMDGPHGGK